MCQGINFFPEIETLGLIASRIMRPLANQSRESPSGERECGWYLDTGTQGGAHSSLAPLGRPDSENHIALQLSHRDFGAFDFAPWQLKRPSYTRELISVPVCDVRSHHYFRLESEKLRPKSSILASAAASRRGTLAPVGLPPPPIQFQRGAREHVSRMFVYANSKKNSTIIC